MDIPPDAHLAGVEPVPLAKQNEVAVRRSNLSQSTNSHVEAADPSSKATPAEPAGRTPARGVRIARVYAALLIIVLLGLPVYFIWRSRSATP